MLRRRTVDSRARELLEQENHAVIFQQKNHFFRRLPLSGRGSLAREATVLVENRFGELEFEHERLPFCAKRERQRSCKLLTSLASKLWFT